jgi:type I site-specific restriction endonuclease
MPTEADTCRTLITPKLQAAGWRIFSLSVSNGERAGVRCRNLQLAERGIDFQQVALQAGKPDADPFDLLCHLAFNAHVLTRRQHVGKAMWIEPAEVGALRETASPYGPKG